MEEIGRESGQPPTVFVASYLEQLREAEETADLWRFHSLGGTRVEEWQARLRAAPNRRAALRVLDA